MMDWIKTHWPLIAALFYAAALAAQGHYEAAVGIVLAALSGGIKPVPLPPPAA